MFWSYYILNFWFPWLHIFGLNVRNVPKMGSECQIFASFRARIIIFCDMKHIINLKEIPRNGFNQCIEIAPNDL